MASNQVYIAAPPETVWEILADADSYAHWVVGSSKTRHVTGRWPARGSCFHHTQGVAGFGLRDSTEAIESKRPSRLVLEVRMRPLLVARVELSLRAHAEGTWLTMRESAFAGLAGRFAGPLLEPLLTLRNVESLRRLRRLAERRHAH